METTLKHFGFYNPNNSERGRFAVRINNIFQLAQISGNAPSVSVLKNVIIALGEEFIIACNNAHISRKNPYAVTKSVSPYGSFDYRLIVRKNDYFANYPVAARIHVSMYGKLNDDVNLWIGDLPPMMAAIETDPDFNNTVEVWEETIVEPDWNDKTDLIPLLSIMSDGSFGIDHADINEIRPGAPLFISDYGGVTMTSEELAEIDNYLGPETLAKIMK